MRALGLLALTLLAAACGRTGDLQSATRTFSVKKVGEGGGIVRSLPNGIDCGHTCTGNFPQASTFRLEAVPDEASEFIGWSEDCDGRKACIVNLDTDRAVTAEFRPRLTVIPTRKLSLSTVGEGLGFITADVPADLYCEGACVRTYSDGVQVQLRATPVGSRFTGWSGACSGDSPTCTVTIREDLTVIAEFAPPIPSLSVSMSGQGIVNSTPAGIECREGTCGAQFSVGETVTLTAIAEPGWEFMGWSGECTGRGPCAVTIDGTHGVSASFTLCEGHCPFAWTTDATGTVISRALASDDTGVYWLGTFGDGVTTSEIDFGFGPLSAHDSDIFLAKFAHDGSTFWAKRLGSVGDDRAFDLTVNSAGEVFVTGSFMDTVDFGGGPRTSAGGRDAFVAKFDFTGRLRWVQTFGTTSSDEATAIELTLNGDVIVAGNVGNTSALNLGGKSISGRAFLARMDSNGGVRWAKGISTGSKALSINSLALSSLGAIAVGGTFVGTHDLGGGLVTAASTDVFVARYDAAGNFLWARQVSGDGAEFGGSVAVGVNDEIYAVGSTTSKPLLIAGWTDDGGLGSEEPWIASFSPYGDLNWSRRYPVSTSSPGAFDGVAVDGFGKVVVSGILHAATQFDTEWVIPTTSTLALLRLDGAGGITSVEQYPGVQHGQVRVAPSGNILLNGTQQGADFGVPPGLLRSNGDADPYFAVLSP